MGTTTPKTLPKSEAIELLEQQLRLEREKVKRMREAIRELLALRADKIDCQLPKGFFDKKNGYEKGDENAPFFSEGLLYSLIGKDAARSVLSRVNALVRESGVTPNQLADVVRAQEELGCVVNKVKNATFAVCQDKQAQAMQRLLRMWFDTDQRINSLYNSKEEEFLWGADDSPQ